MTQLTPTETQSTCLATAQVTKSLKNPNEKYSKGLPTTSKTGCLGLDQATYMTHLHTCLFPMRKPVLSQSAEDSVHCHKQPVSLSLQGSILERAAQMHILQQEFSISENSAEA